MCSICTENTSSLSSCFEGTLSHPREFAWSKTCSCCSIPLSLFIVSKQMKAEAEYTFFRYNGFEFFPTRSLDICRYLGGLIENKLRLIRDLRFIFGSQQCQYWDRIGRKDWRLLLNWIKHNQNLRDLRLVIDVERHFVYPGYVSPSHSWRFEDSLAYTDLYEVIYEIAMLVVVIREKLKGLHLRLPYFHSWRSLWRKKLWVVTMTVTNEAKYGKPWREDL